jgi:hypothetical protein
VGVHGVHHGDLTIAPIGLVSLIGAFALFATQHQLDRRLIMDDCRTPDNCENFPLCEHLKSITGDIPANVLFLCPEELQLNGKSVCAKCPHFKGKKKAATQ